MLYPGKHAGIAADLFGFDILPKFTLFLKECAFRGL
jgi:hypothetical protein